MTSSAVSALRSIAIEDKIKLLTGQGFSQTHERMPGTDRFVPGAAGYTYAIQAQGIPSLVLADGPAGLRLAPEHPETGEPQYVTAFPIATLIASSWDVELTESVGAAMATEAAAFGVDILLAPGMNLHRNPLTGRNFEYFSEDPILSGHMAGALVRGMQSKGVGGTIKHFVANNQETNRFVVDTLVEQRALRELYFRGFEIAIREGAPWAIMTSYNRLNGCFTSQDKHLLKTVLRDELGFDGVIMTDWFAGDDPVAQIDAGNNLIMPGTRQSDKALQEAYKNGSLAEDVIDENATWILSALDRVAQAAKPAPTNAPPLEEHGVFARRVAAESTVLLKNDGETLPLGASVGTVALFGVGSYSTVSGGTGSGDVAEAYIMHVADGLSESGLNVHEGLSARYTDFVADFYDAQDKPETVFEEFLMQARPDEMAISDATVRTAAAEADVAIITISRNSGEFVDREVEGDFDLTSAELDLLKSVSETFRAADKRVIVVLNIGNVIEVASWRGLADAIILPWQGGQESGRAIADVLSGRVNPSGRLPMTFPISYADTPSAPYFPGTEDRSKSIEIMGGLMRQYESEVSYEEGIFVGYRHFTSTGREVAYPFGYGLSYTQFEYRDLQVEHSQDGAFLTIGVSVVNAGAVAGRTVVQVYVDAPDGKLETPRRELKAFTKTKTLDAGKLERVEMRIPIKDLASFDPDGARWIVGAGVYKFHAATSADDLGLQTTLAVPEDRIIETVSSLPVA